MLVFIIFLVIPLIEISLFVTIGEEIGLFTTLLLCVLTAILGASFLRQQGLKTLLSAQEHLSRGSVPLQEIFDGFCLAIAGATLITPGFFTDLIGFTLLFPPARHYLWTNLPRFFDINPQQHPYHQPDYNRQDTSQAPTSVTDVEFERIDEEKNKSEKNKDS